MYLTCSYLLSLAAEIHLQSGILHKPSVSAGCCGVTCGADVGHLLPTAAGHLPDRGAVCFRSVQQFLWIMNFGHFGGKKAKTFVSSACAQVLFVSISVYTLCILCSHPALFTAITVYTHCVSCLHIALCLYTTAHTLCCLCFNLFLSIPTLPPTLCAPNSHAW